MAVESVERDAKTFGVLVKAGGLFLGVLVARNVKPGQAGRPKAENVSQETNSDDKVTMNEFAKLSGVGLATVSRYYKAYQHLSEAGEGFEAPEQLKPGVDPAELESVEETDVERLEELWRKMVRKARGDEPKPEGTQTQTEPERQRLPINAEDLPESDQSDQSDTGATDAQIAAVASEDATEAEFELLRELIEIRQDVERAKESIELAVMFAPAEDEQSREQLDLIENLATAILSMVPKFKGDNEIESETESETETTEIPTQ